MTIICCKVEKDKVTIGSDTQITAGYSGFNFNGTKLEKVGTLIVGTTGRCALHSVYVVWLETHKLPSLSKRDVNRHFVAFNKFLINDYDNKILLSDVIFIICQNGEAITFQNFYIRKITKFWAIGSGREMAWAALSLGKSVKEAVKLACQYNSYCSGKIDIMTSVKEI